MPISYPSVARLLALLLFAAPASLSAQDEQEAVSDPSACHALQNDLQRLGCYDRLTAFNAPSEPIFESTVSWTLIEDTDPLSGRDVSRAYVNASEQRGGRDAPEFIMIQCNREGGYELFVGTTGFIGGVRDRVPVTYRWNNDEAISEVWHSSTSGKAAFLPIGYRDFLSGLQQGGHLVFEWEDYRGARTQGIWENLELDEIARFIQEGCPET